MTTRPAIFDAINRQPEVSVLIIGGGINGVGLFWELALQGIDVLLVDKSDFCAGCSAASTRVIHGGLRYLENAEFRLVRESLKERNLLLRNAPHYVKPLPTTIPIFSWTAGLFTATKNFLRLSARPGDRGALLIKVGLTLYDVLAGRQSPLPAHRFQSKRAALRLRPLLNPNIVSTATYYDARITYPERLCLELVEDAEAASPGARALNYVRVCDAAGDTVTLRDEVSGETCAVKPRIVVNAAGAWIDVTNRAMRRDTQYIGGTKGSHLVLDHPELFEATRGEMIYFANRDGRVCIFYPFYDKIIAGSTDIPVDDPETAVCDEDEVDYILDSMRKAFPSLTVDRSHIVFRFCGVRPLPRSDALVPGQVSRDHSFPLVPPGEGISFPIYSLVGGKWTTFRAFAEQATDQLLAELGRPRLTSTDCLPIGGGKGYPQTEADTLSWLEAMHLKTHLSQERLTALLDRYGSRAEEVAACLAEAPDSPLEHHPGYSQREVAFIAARERVVHLDDLILRRTLMGLLGQLSHELLEELVGIVAPVVGWPQQQAEEEIERTVKLLASVHGVTIGQTSPSPAHT